MGALDGSAFGRAEALELFAGGQLGRGDFIPQRAILSCGSDAGRPKPEALRPAVLLARAVSVYTESPLVLGSDAFSAVNRIHVI
jgi:hypothetical protein